MAIPFAKPIRLGYAPVRRTLSTPKAFSLDDALRTKQEVLDVLRTFPNVDIITLDELNEEGLMSVGAHGDQAAELFRREKVDAVFIPHCNFGCEEAVAKVAKKTGKPVLIWGPRDEKPDADGVRPRDSQCGLFASTNVLGRFGVPFNYIINSHVKDEVFRRGFQAFIGSAAVVRAMTHLRVGQIGTRPDAFWSVKCNESELLERFGIEVAPINMTDLKKFYLQEVETHPDQIEEKAQELREAFPTMTYSGEELSRVAGLIITIRNWMHDFDVSVAAGQCWEPMAREMGISPCFAFSELTNMGLPMICEADIHGAITSAMVQAANFGETPIFLADLTTRHPENDNAELLWHCGVFPRKLIRDVEKARLALHHNRNIPAVGAWEIKGGEMTLARFDGQRGKYSLFLGEGRGVDGPYTFGTYGYVEVNNWPEWEERLIYGPYIHHCVGVHSRVVPALYGALRYLPGIEPDLVDPTEAQVRKYLRGQ